MIPVARLALARALDAIDALFDAAAALWRVLVRGAFSPDAHDYRGARWARLSPDDVLVQTIAINAEDAAQARRIIRLDAARRLPLPESAALFDVAGPLPAGDAPRLRAEQDFLLGVARCATLEDLRARDAKQAHRIEGFVYEPPEAPGAAFVFRDEAGDRRRRIRRGVLAVALAAFAWSGADAFDAWRTRLETAVARAESEQMHAQRAIRRDARRLADARAALRALAATQPVGRVGEQLAALARRLPAHTELRRVEWSARGLALAGASYAPRDMELELRRLFAGADIAFETTAHGPPDQFEAQIAWRPR
ncbi:MAG: hypothetical protein JNJ73_15340 [Hyphomonadaceae bacterium]|nr:hypothetical protein [Hyphomonadaceae bacterium]